MGLPTWEYFFICDAEGEPVEYIGRYAPGMRFVFNGETRKQADQWRLHLYSKPHDHTIATRMGSVWMNGVDFHDNFLMATYLAKGQRAWAIENWSPADAEVRSKARDIAYGFMTEKMWEHGGFDFQANGVDMLRVYADPISEHG